MEGLEQDTQLLRSLAEHSGLRPAAIAKKAGVAVTTINRPFNASATTRLSQTTIEKLRAAFPQFPGWEEQFGIPRVADESQMVQIAEIDLRLGLGGVIMDEEVLEGDAVTREFPLAWLQQLTRSAPEYLFWAKGQGDSMEPKISNGDVILIDRSQTNPSFGDLYWAIAYGQTAMIKRLRPMPDGSVKILSDNPNVPPEVAYDGELSIFGRVIAVVKTI